MRLMILCAGIAILGLAPNEEGLVGGNSESEWNPPQTEVMPSSSRDGQQGAFTLSASSMEGTRVAAAQEKATSKTTSTVKNQAPVDVQMTPTSSGAELRIKFHSAARDVKIRAWGVDGLEVKDSVLVRSGRYGAQEEVVVQVSFTAPATRCSLALEVSGKFGGRRTSNVRSFTVNEKAERAGEKPADLRTDEEGNPIHVIKSE